MKPNGIIGQLLTALRTIAETDKPLEATSLMNWQHRAKLIARNAEDNAHRDLRRTHVRYCYECGSIGEIDRVKHPQARDCCPDGSHAVYVPQEVAEQARIGFRAQLVEIKDRDITHG